MPGLKVRDIMTQNVITISPETSVKDAAEVMTISAEASVEELADLLIDKKVNPVPVVNEDRVMVGIVSKADIVKLIAGSPELRDKEWRELIKK